MEIEDFEITDYDIQNEFNPNRKRHNLTKEQQVYGIWAQDSGSEDERPSMSSGRKRKDYAAPISFVGGGIVQHGKKPEPKKEEEPEAQGSSDEEPVIIKQTTKNKSGMAGGRRKQAEMDSSQSFGGWEQYTKGVAGKLLLKMGYKPGSGLGKNQQGRVEPVLAKKREGRGAIGRYGSEGLRPKVEQQVIEDIPDEKHQWRKKSEKSTTYVYKSVEEVISEGSNKKLYGDTSQLSKVKVIDMTGPDQKILSGYESIHKQHSRPQEQDDVSQTRVLLKDHKSFALPELSHNLDLLVDMTEQKILRNDRELQHSKDRCVTLEHEINNMEILVTKEQSQISCLEKILEVIDRMEERTNADSTNPMSIDEVVAAFKYMQRDFYEEYRLFEISSLAVAILTKMLKRHFESWDPILYPTFGLDVMKTLKDVLEEDSRHSIDRDGRISDPYHQLVWEAWMPSIRSAISRWSCRNSDPTTKLLEMWMPLLPTWVLDNILDLMVMPQIQQEVDSWDPLTDTVPIHAWVHPWLPLMSTRLHQVFPTIRQKLSCALTKWHPSDPSAKLILMPWAEVFEPGVMDVFLTKNIVPKLILCLQEFQINPHHQQLDAWEWVMEWQDLLSLSTLTSMIDKYLLPRWLQVLCAWLTHNPDLEEVSNWYLGWKNLMPKNILQQPAIKDQFKRALEVMHRAVSNPGGPSLQPGAREHMAYLTSVERQRERDIEMESSTRRDYEHIAQTARLDGNTSSFHLGFKANIERQAEENGIVFLPNPNRFYEGKQVYKFGKLQIVIDRGVIFVQNDQRWEPSSLHNIIDMAK